MGPGLFGLKGGRGDTYIRSGSEFILIRMK